MPWSTSNRRATLPADHHARRARAYREAQGHCQWVENGQRCNTYAPLHKRGNQPAGHGDHIIASGPDTPDNYQWLCPPHHYRKSALEGAQARKAQPSRKHREPEQHPGRLITQGGGSTPSDKPLTGT